MFTTVEGTEDRLTAQQREDRYVDEDSRNTEALRFPFTTMKSISLALENYMKELRNRLFEEIIGDEEHNHYTASSMAIVQLYEDCKFGINGTKLGLIEGIRCFPPTDNKNISQGKKDERVSFKYYSTNRYNSSITEEVEEEQTGCSSSVIGIEDNYSSSKSAHRRFDFVQATWIDTNGETQKSYARIMAILHLDAGKAPAESRDVCFFYIAWLEEDTVESTSTKFSCCPLPRLKYTFHRNTNQLWCDIVGLDRIVQPVDAFHDSDIRPSYFDEGSSIANMRENRFFAIPLSVAKIGHSKYSHIIGRGEMLITEDNHAFRRNGMPVNDRSRVKKFFEDYLAPRSNDDDERDVAII
jgi:hypothetical protein